MKKVSPNPKYFFHYKPFHSWMYYGRPSFSVGDLVQFIRPRSFGEGEGVARVVSISYPSSKKHYKSTNDVPRNKRPHIVIVVVSVDDNKIYNAYPDMLMKLR